MKALISALLIFLTFPIFSQEYSEDELSAWASQAQRVTIIRDTWGVPHIYADTDEDVVFGFMYAQCEDDFARIEHNYMRGLGRLSEIEGKNGIFNDLWAKAYQDSLTLIRKYNAMSPEMQGIMQSFANGMNYYLATHPEVTPKLLTRFEPWFPLAYSEGSSEGNVSNQTDISRSEIAEFFSTQFNPDGSPEKAEDKGSNGMAVAPSRTVNGNALLLINPHVSLYHRLEAHLSSGEGLDVYGAVSKGQFFIYHGFNNYCGWMHTSSGTDTHDAFLVRVKEEDGIKYYSYGDDWREIRTKVIRIGYLDDEGNKTHRIFTVDYTHHGPIVAKRDEFYVAITPLHMPEKELEQEWKTMKTTGLDSFTEVMKIRSNATNNTVYADKEGNIAYWNGNFVPRRNPAANYRLPVMSSPENDWNGLHPLEEIIQVQNPASGWIQNCNSTPFLSAGPDSPEPGDYPAYMTGHHQNPRAANAIRLLDNETAFTPEKLRLLAHDNYLQVFDILLPSLFHDYDNMPENSPVRQVFHEHIQALKEWDRRATPDSDIALLAMNYARNVTNKAGPYITDADRYTMNLESFPAVIAARDKVTPSEKVEALKEAVAYMQTEYGTWRKPLGEVFRFQRISDHPTRFEDEKPSLPSRYLSAFYGSLPAGGYYRQDDSEKQYLTGGNSFVGVVEFGEEVKAWTVVAGGQSSHPDSEHYTDQMEMYLNGELKEVFFKKEDVMRNKEREYHPGE